jgi:HSP20 family protein
LFRSPLEWLTDETWMGSDGGSLADTVPAMDVRETDTGYVVEVAMPGIRPDDVEVTLDGRLLTIRGKTGTQHEEGDQGRYLLRERRTLSFARAITLPAEVDAEAVTSSFEDGELRLVLPISSRAGSRRIPIGVGTNARQVSGQTSDAGPRQDASSSKTNGQTATGNGQPKQASHEGKVEATAAR